MRKSVLVVENDEMVLLFYRRSGLHEKYKVTVVKDLKTLHSIPDPKTFDAMVMDACVVERTPDTLPFIKSVREVGYSGFMIPNSSDYNEILIKAGCDRRVPGIGTRNHGNKLEGKELVTYLDYMFKSQPLLVEQRV